MKLIKRLRPQVKVVALILIAVLCGLTASYIYNECKSTTSVHIYTMARPSDAEDFIRATEGTL